MQAGQNPHDPLTQLNSHLGFGALAGFNPFTDMGVNPNDPNMVRASARVTEHCDNGLIHHVDANHDELTTVPSANVQSHVESCHP